MILSVAANICRTMSEAALRRSARTPVQRVTYAATSMTTATGSDGKKRKASSKVVKEVATPSKAPKRASTSAKKAVAPSKAINEPMGHEQMDGMKPPPK